MKENNELERSDIAIDGNMEVDCDEGTQITAYIETWFDVDKKFMVHTDVNGDTWLNMYARYNPFEDTLKIECVICNDKSDQEFEYYPTKAESDLIKEMITEKLRQTENKTPQEFCDSFTAVNDLEFGGIQ